MRKVGEKRRCEVLRTTCKLYQSRSEQLKTKIGTAFETYSTLSSVGAGAS